MGRKGKKTLVKPEAGEQLLERQKKAFISSTEGKEEEAMVIPIESEKEAEKVKEEETMSNALSESEASEVEDTEELANLVEPISIDEEQETA